MWFLGMDVGTGGTRAVIVNAAGKLMGSASSEHAPFRAEHPGWAEQDPEDWWRAAKEAIRGIAATPEPREPIAALALTGQMHGAVMLDEDGQVLRPSLIWCDTRTQPECDWLTEKIGRERLIELTCNPALPNFTLTKLLWVKTHQPEIFANIRHVMCPKDYVRYRLTGEFAIDVQEASGTLLLDVTNRRWSREVAEAAGIDESWLPQRLRVARGLRAHHRRSRRRSPASKPEPPSPPAPETRAPERSAWAFCSRAPSRPPSAPPASSSPPPRSPPRIPRAACTPFATPFPACGTSWASPRAAGSSLSWLKETFFAGQSYDSLSADAAKFPPCSHGVIGHLICSANARRTSTPKCAPPLSASTPATRPRISSARCLKASPYSLKDTFTLFAELGIPVTGIRLGGGGARGNLWRRIQAGIYAHTVEVLTAEEGGAFGCALMAGVAAGHWANLDEACAQAIEVAQRIEPVADDVAAYKAGYAHWRKLYPALRSMR